MSTTKSSTEPTTAKASKPDKATQDLQDVVDKIAGWPEPYATIGARLHETILSAGPKLKPRIWYGMPGYATSRTAPVVVFFRLDDGNMSLGLSEKATVAREPGTTLHPSAWFLTEIDDPTLAKVSELVRTAFS
ncbi:protein of unknown function (DU1801) [Sanguibacter keddieii DSM 10542]|uniref:YdhG-like domain-containing protein n=1 Tax=Sanguibacter keddieii (strain ATCC 51767 / DSM 10542 / NCFB 3025 / ST-74) TaxID=446469 RepID=D1BHF9_SANKS|nr:hypothetical protein [Sanguibacter keddieii]ACZ21879.1 protein of unknown function (DU1801) [Sanguibacter keddieii DSM 10542]